MPILWVVLALAFSLLPAHAADRSHARSMVVSRDGIVATSHTLASQAGAEILARGGSAVDAAIAANAVLGLVEPMMCGIGGDVFVLYWDAKTQKLYGLNGSGWSPQGLTQEFLAGQDIKDKMPQHGIHSTTVPGAVRGWEAAHKRFGKLPWKDLFGATIHHAEQGFPVTEIIAGAWNSRVPRLEPGSEKLFFPGGKAPTEGEIFRNPDLGRAMRLIAEQGAGVFYEGEIAQAILKTSHDRGGTFAAADLAEWQPEWVEPLSTTYRGWTVSELPPNGQGIAALVMLNLMEQTKASPAGPFSTPEVHKKIEAMKLAYADLYAYVADPKFQDVPVAGMLSKQYAAERAKGIDPKKANCEVKAGAPEWKDTTYLAVVDGEGNIASWIESVSGSWGSGVLVDGMGFHLHNRGGGFTLDDKHPSRLEPRKRPFHTIIPGFMTKGDQHIGFGIMSGPNQPQAHAQFAANIADYGMNLQEALEAPRFRVTSVPGCKVSIESRYDKDVLVRLNAMGHELNLRGDHSTVMGRGNAVMHNSKTKVNSGASDSRADGFAIPEPLRP
ncbi:MAG: gamma-glutamyltransferase [Acidobacteria bacterium]|nr:gamma-glutamyltransferase [Acidobacteriota bacterium]